MRYPRGFGSVIYYNTNFTKYLTLPCGVLLYRQKVPSIFEQLKKLNNPLFAEALEIGQILLYSLEE